MSHIRIALTQDSANFLAYRPGCPHYRQVH